MESDSIFKKFAVAKLRYFLSMLAPTKTLWSTPKSCIDTAADLAKLRPDDILYDIGCGDGRVLLHIASKLQDASPRKMVGIELSSDRAQVARNNVKEAIKANLFPSNIINIEIKCANALEVDYSDATVAFLYLMRRGLRLIKPLLYRQGNCTRVVTYMTGFQDVTPKVVVKCKVRHHQGAAWPVYLFDFSKTTPQEVESSDMRS